MGAQLIFRECRRETGKAEVGEAEETSSTSMSSDVARPLHIEFESDTTPNEIVLAIGSGCENDDGVEVGA